MKFNVNQKFDVLISPRITEKATKLTGEVNSYVFVVNKFANKKQIKEAVESYFNVKVENVQTLNLKGKTKVFRGSFGVRPSIKKAIVRLAADNKIDFAIGG